jgi:hypothetical protein
MVEASEAFQMVRGKFFDFLFQLWPNYVYPNLGLIVYITLLAIAGYLVGRVCKWIVTKTLGIIGLKRMTSRSWVESLLKITGYRGNIIGLMGDIVKWFVYILFLSAIVQTIGFLGMAEFFTQVASWMPKLIIAILIIIFGFIVSDFFGRIFEEAGRQFLRDEGIAKFGSGLVKYSVAMVIIIMTLSLLGLDTTSLLVLLAGILGATLIMLAFGMKDILPNLVAAMQLRSLLKIGETIEVEGCRGAVEKIDTLGVTLTSGRKRYVLPNTMVLKKVVVREVK